MVIAGHQSVKADWTKLSPTNAVSNNQYVDTQWASASERRIMIPASIRTAVWTVMLVPFWWLIGF